MPNSLRPLLPATGDHPPNPPPGPPSPSRRKKLVLAACLTCRNAKTKCDGGRPACGRCVEKALECNYDVDANTTRVGGLKRRIDVLQDELDDFRELFECIRTRHEREVDEIVRRIRETGDPVAVLRFIREGDMLLQPLESTFGSASAGSAGSNEGTASGKFVGADEIERQTKVLQDSMRI